MSTLKVNDIEPQSGSDVGIAATTISLVGAVTADDFTSADATITGGSVTGITDLAIADGGTGASTAGAALTNLGVSSFAQTLLDDADAATARSTLGVADATLSVDRFSGDGAETDFTLGADPGSENNTWVYIDGVYQQKDQYSVTGTTLAFSTAPPTGTDNIEVVRGRTSAIGVPGDATVTTDKIDDDAVTAAKIADEAVTGPAILESSVAPILLVSGTPQATTSGTSKDFTNIPSWVKRITLLLSGVSTSGTDNILIQIGDSGGIENTGYLGAGGLLADSAAVSVGTSTTGFVIRQGNSSNVMHGRAVLDLLDADTFTWAYSCTVGMSSSGTMIIGGGSKSLSATLDRVRFTTTSGTDTFDAGKINILYE